MPAVVANNGHAGIAVSGAAAVNNLLLPAQVRNNGGLPIDMGNDGPTLNDPGDFDFGPDTLLNYPEVTVFAGSTLTGTACANCTVLVYLALGNPAAPGGGGIELDKTSADGAGHWHITLGGGRSRLDVSLQTCQGLCLPGSNTSELSPRPLLYLPLVTR